MTHDIRYKACPLCDTTYARTAENFQRDAHRPDGLSPYCKECASVKRKARYWADPAKWRERQIEYVRKYRNKHTARA
jgi:hypothetical protein